MKYFLQEIRSIAPEFSEEELYIPISETCVDSLDLVQIRNFLENFFHYDISDEKWFEIKTLEQAHQYFHENRGVSARNDVDRSKVVYEDLVQIRMPQMANSALSEYWLLKYLGDTHWQLLSAGFNKKSSEFRDSSNNRLYATFLRIKLETSPLNDFFENEDVRFKSSIEGFGRSSFITEINGNSDINYINSTIMTTFTIKSSDNSLKTSEEAGSCKIIVLDDLPEFVRDYRLLKKNLAEKHSSGGWEFEVGKDILYRSEYKIIPYYDINGVGLLYFAAYPLISDICLEQYLPEINLYQTIFRDIFYFSNCETSDVVEFNLKWLKKENGKILLSTALYRKSDNKLLSIIYTVKKDAIQLTKN